MRAPALRLISALVISLPHAANAAGCFTIYDAENVVTYRSTTAPVDMSRSISDQMAVRFPGQFLVWSKSASSCPELTGNATGTGSAAFAGAPQARGVTRGLKDTTIRVPSSIGGSVQTRGTPSPASREAPAVLGAPPTCHIGPRGGRYTITPSGKKNYDGC
jgi:hypothetical protein